VKNDEGHKHVVIEVHRLVKLVINQSSDTVLVFDRVCKLPVDIVNQLCKIEFCKLNFHVCWSLSFQDHELFIKKNASKIDNEV